MLGCPGGCDIHAVMVCLACFIGPTKYTYMIVLAFDIFSQMAAYSIVSSHVIVTIIILYFSGYTDVLIDPVH